MEKKTIIVVDDMETNTFTVGFALNMAGYNVVKAQSPKEALTYFDGRKVDLLITDFNMPGMNGAQLIKAVKEIPAYQQVPVLVLSSEKSEQHRRDALEAGALKWIEKPYMLKTFMKTVEDAMR